MDYNIVEHLIPTYLTKIKVGFVSTYPPRECGIATYTKNLVEAVSRFNVLKKPEIIAINDKIGHYNYDCEVEFQIARERVKSYVEAAEYINDSEIDVVNLQHEFGLFGGTWGNHVIAFLEKLEKPIITTLHTVLLEPPQDASRVLYRILQNSDYTIVMARVGAEWLQGTYPSQRLRAYHPAPPSAAAPNVPATASAATTP